MKLRKPTDLLSPQNNKIDTDKKIEKSQTSLETVDTPKNYKKDRVDRADKSKSIPVTNLSNKSAQIEKPSEINIHKDNKYVSYLYR